MILLGLPGIVGSTATDGQPGWSWTGDGQAPGAPGDGQQPGAPIL